MNTKYSQGYWQAKRKEPSIVWTVLGFALVALAWAIGDYLWRHGF